MPDTKNRKALAQFEVHLRHRINAGRVAVQAQIPFFGRQFGQVPSEWKPDDTRVTFADFAISEKLFAELRRDFPEDDFCSEESSPLDEHVPLEADFAWVVDPIDGTNNYALGFPLCAISLALLHQGQPVYGFIYDHSTAALLEGGPGAGVFRNRKRINRDLAASEAQSMLGLHFPIPEERLRHLAPLLSKYRVRCLGSAALTGAYVATGYLSGALDFHVKVWDIAAVSAICQGVGLDLQFLGTKSFPLKEFHSSLEACPYWVGTACVSNELRTALTQRND